MDRVIAFVRDKLLGLALDAAQGQILGVARALLGLVGDQQDALTAIGAQVSDAANAHLEAGRLQFNRAVEAERPDADRDHLLREARSNLQLFVSNASVPHASRSFAYIYLYLTDIALRNRRDAERDLRTAHLEAARAALVVDQSPFARPVWVKTELVDYLNALGDLRRAALGDPVSFAPRFIGGERDARDLGIHDWRNWAYGYANREESHRRRADVLQLAARAGVDNPELLRRTLDMVDAREAVHVRFLDEWVADQAGSSAET